ncbi:MAG: nucleotide exchange factor GrpE [Desulfobacteraceae bacterium]|nr:nucleotide exchange factor GrpE [Desulfobacteraceae bacterium]
MSKRIEIQDDMETAPVDGEEIVQEVAGSGQEQSDDAAAEDKPKDDTAAQLAAARQEAQNNYDRLLRATADFENYKKRTAREMQDLVKYANERILKELLAVVDNLERAIESAAGSRCADDPLLKGVDLTLNETLKILDRHQVSPIKAIGEPFDPNFHQAMMQEAADDQPPNTVVKELQKGYKIHDRLLRPALVSVSKAGNAKTDTTE